MGVFMTRPVYQVISLALGPYATNSVSEIINLHAGDVTNTAHHISSCNSTPTTTTTTTTTLHLAIHL